MTTQSYRKSKKDTKMVLKIQFNKTKLSFSNYL